MRCPPQLAPRFLAGDLQVEDQRFRVRSELRASLLVDHDSAIAGSTSYVPGLNCTRPVMISCVTLSELHSLRSMTVLPLPMETALEVTEGLGRQLGVGESIGTALLSSLVEEKDPSP